MEFIADAKQVDPDKPFFLYFCPGATHAPHHVPKEWADRYKGAFDDGWDAYREKVFARQMELGHRPAGRRAVAPRPGRAGLGVADRRATAAVRPDDGGVRRVPDPHRPPHRAAARLPGEHRRARQHADHGGVGQRRQRRGRPDRHDQRGAVLQQRAGAVRGQPRGDRRDRRAQALQPLPVGLDVRRQHAVPPLEARDLPRRRVGPVHRQLAQGHQGDAARCASSTRTPSTWCRPCSTCSGSSRRRRSAACRNHRCTG